MPRLLELFSGTGSIGRAFAARGWEVVSVAHHLLRRHGIGRGGLGHFDFVWASPVCTEYSRALTKRPRNLEAGDRLVLRTLEIIENLRPRWWAMENPQTGLLKTRLMVQGLPYSDVCYCKYGFRYKKATRIWPQLTLGGLGDHVPQGRPLPGLCRRHPPRGCPARHHQQSPQPAVPEPAVQHAPQAL